MQDEIQTSGAGRDLRTAEASAPILRPEVATEQRIAPVAAPAESSDRQTLLGDRPPVAESSAEPLAPLFSPDLAKELRTFWDAIQIGFVDDPEQAVRDADALVVRALKSLEETFAAQRDGFQAAGTPEDQGSTENLRTALRRYRSFFHRLLTL